MQSWKARTMRGLAVASCNESKSNAGLPLKTSEILIPRTGQRIAMLFRSALFVLSLGIVCPALAQSVAPIASSPAPLPDAPDTPSYSYPVFADKSSYFGTETPTFLLAVNDQSQQDPQNPPPANPQAPPPANPPATGQKTTPPASGQQTTPPATPAQTGDQKPGGASGVAPDLKGSSQQGQEQVKKQEKQRILGVIPAFNSVYEGTVPPLTPGQKMRLMFKSTTDVYVFGFAAVTAGIGQAQDSHAAYGQGLEGYAKRFGANYADTADGNFWGNAILPIVLHEDPRYFRLGEGTLTHRLLYSMSTAVWCKRDNGTSGPNYANVFGNLIAGGISNVYYPEADRGLGNTLQNAATVTAEGMIGAALIEFWPDIAEHYHQKRQAKRDAEAAAARNAQQANPTGQPPQ
jgi:hypothetical protein